MVNIKNYLSYFILITALVISPFLMPEVNAGYTPNGDEIAGWGRGIGGRHGGFYYNRGGRGYYGRGYYRRGYYPRQYRYGYYNNYYPRRTYRYNYYNPYQYYYNRPGTVQFYWGR